MPETMLPASTWPRMPAPSGPIRSGRLRGAAAEDAADQDDAVAADTGEQGQDLQAAQEDGSPEAQLDQPPVGFDALVRFLLLARPLPARGRRVPGLGRVARGLAP